MTGWCRSQNCSLGREVSGRGTEEPSPEEQKGWFSHLVSSTWLTGSEQTKLWGGVILYSFLSFKSETTIGITSRTFSKQPLSCPLLLVPATALCLIWPMVMTSKMCLLSKSWANVAARATLSKDVSHVFAFQWLAIQLKTNASTAHSNSLHQDWKSFSESPHSEYVRLCDLTVTESYLT